MKNLLIIAISIVFSLSFSACSKDKFGDITPFVGQWEASMRVLYFDSLGNQVADSTFPNLGTVTITKDPEEVSFNPFAFPEKVSMFAPLDYLVSSGATIGSNTGGTIAVYISPDIDNERAKFWGVSTFYGSIADLAMITKMKSNEIEFTAIKGRAVDPSDSLTSTIAVKQYLMLKKK